MRPKSSESLPVNCSGVMECVVKLYLLISWRTAVYVVVWRLLRRIWMSSISVEKAATTTGYAVRKLKLYLTFQMVSKIVRDERIWKLWERGPQSGNIVILKYPVVLIFYVALYMLDVAPLFTWVLCIYTVYIYIYIYIWICPMTWYYTLFSKLKENSSCFLTPLFVSLRVTPCWGKLKTRRKSIRPSQRSALAAGATE